MSEKQSKHLPDTQGELEPRGIAIRRVGIRSVKYPLSFQDRDEKVVSVPADFNMSVALSGDQRGTHMSRFLAILNEQKDAVRVQTFSGLIDRMLERLESESGTFLCQFPYFVLKEAPISKEQGYLDYQVTLRAEIDGSKRHTALSVLVPVKTLCPCSRNISNRGAHNQRGEVALSVIGEPLPWVRDLIDLVESSASSPLYSVLKRPDEKFVTESAYDNPVFVEDLVRNVSEKLNSMPQVLGYRVEAENFESIHNHSAFAIVDKDFPSSCL